MGPASPEWVGGRTWAQVDSWSYAVACFWTCVWFLDHQGLTVGLQYPLFRKMPHDLKQLRKVKDTAPAHSDALGQVGQVGYKGGFTTCLNATLQGGAKTKPEPESELFSRKQIIPELELYPCGQAHPSASNEP